MAALAASVSPWIPEDDLLLKNAVEAGASLEALAKGAVRFSRKFTVRELRDRWRSLLYDPAVSAEASARMIEFDVSVCNRKVSPEVVVKRKLETVRRLYYAMRKKTCKRPGNFPAFGLLGGPGIDDIPFDTVFGDRNQRDFGLVKQCYSELRVEVPSFPENDSLFHADDLPSSLELWETIEDISEPAMPMSVCDANKGLEGVLVHCDDVEMDDGKKVSSSDMNLVHAGEILQHKDSIDVLNCSTVISESDYADLSESLLNFANEDDLLVDTLGEDQIDKSRHDGVLVSCTNGVRDKELEIKDSKTLISEQRLVIPDDTDLVEAVFERSLCGNVEHGGHLCIESSSLSSVSTANMESFDGDMVCTLNSEDPDIPCNDDFLVPREITSSITRPTSRKIGYPPYLFANLKDEKQEKSLPRKEEKAEQSCISPHMKGQGLLPSTQPGQKLVGHGGKYELPDDIACIKGSNAQRDGNQRATLQTTLTSAAVGVPKTEVLHTCNTLDVPLYARGCSNKQVTSVSKSDPIISNHEESESDEDMPSYSDIEALILGMDLCPDDTDSCTNREVLRYQNDDTRRNIIRLEQCAQSCIRRSIASRGALAVLYGHHLKHYIRETEVVLGRATEDVEIDIDLGREGPANKISRRQALIRMETDGSFLLKNLGKSLVFLNGQEVATGQSMILGSGSLIEIGEMAFMFEINTKAVRRHLVNTANNRREKNTKFEWSEGVP
ncbi:Forkhead-associated (FHA) domain-containing protein [Euphorbia peplus]|nr:Forkhead-associated (FHA) domain-containing protein [Euphorbia peplus]